MIRNKRQKNRSFLSPRILPNSRKGLSAIITTLLVVMLVLVAVGIVWAVVSGVLIGGAEDIEIAAKCLHIDVRASAVNCGTEIPIMCNATFERTGTEYDEIAGVKLVFRDSVNVESSTLISETGNIEHLVGKTTIPIASGVIAADSLEVTAYFEDASGNEKLCEGQTTTFTF